MAASDPIIFVVLQFLGKNKSDHQTIAKMLHHLDNNWIRENVEDWNDLITSSKYENPRGSILSENMGLSKALTTLMFILAIIPSALNACYQLGNSKMISAATP
ncbi:hypothetical protein VP01_5364g1, partial [Puccinia sorghi]